MEEKLKLMLDEIYFNLDKMKQIKSGFKGDLREGYQLALYDMESIVEKIKSRFELYNQDFKLTTMEDIVFELEAITGFLKDYKKPVRTTIPQKFKEYIFQKYNSRCNFCGSNINLQIDHLIPISRGGTDDLDNLQLLCIDCNKLKSNRIFKNGKDN
jgi:5-methylcytosine-specific restriction endonuclease McrA